MNDRKALEAVRSALYARWELLRRSLDNDEREMAWTLYICALNAHSVQEFSENVNERYEHG